MNTEKRNFDKDAALWDENPVRLKMTQDIANTIITHIPLSSAMDVLDFGCGYGTFTIPAARIATRHFSPATAGALHHRGGQLKGYARHVHC